MGFIKLHPLIFSRFRCPLWTAALSVPGILSLWCFFVFFCVFPCVFPVTVTTSVFHFYRNLGAWRGELLTMPSSSGWSFNTKNWEGLASFLFFSSFSLDTYIHTYIYLMRHVLWGLCSFFLSFLRSPSSLVGWEIYCFDGFFCLYVLGWERKVPIDNHKSSFPIGMVWNLAELVRLRSQRKEGGRLSYHR